MPHDQADTGHGGPEKPSGAPQTAKAKDDLQPPTAAEPVPADGRPTADAAHDAHEASRQWSLSG